MSSDPSTTSPNETVGWGILATGKIARQFAADLAEVPGARLSAVGSRSLAKAEEFAREYAGHGPVRAHGSYQELVEDPDVDVVYVATPHSLHLDDARLALEAGKHVLCEKPLTLRTADAEELFAIARAKGLFAMEAMWTACHPVVRAVQDGLRAGRFGAPRHLHAELGFVAPADPTSRLLDPALGAGALLDMGIYPLTFAHLLFGEAEALAAQANLQETEGGSFDLDIVMTGRYPGGALATMVASLTSWSSRRAAIATDTGRLELDDFHHPTRVVFTPMGTARDWSDDHAPTEPFEVTGDEPVIGRGYGNEALEVNRCIREGLLESPLVPHAQTLTIMRQMDSIRAAVGIVYPEA